jgi:Uma2 family endonuclease
VAYILRHPIGNIYAEKAFSLSESRVCVPDVAFLATEFAAKGDPEHIYRGAPELAIEVVSESESALELRGKIQDYLDAGSRAAWAIYPKFAGYRGLRENGSKGVSRRSGSGSP